MKKASKNRPGKRREVYAGQKPKVSVIIPVYNGERYLKGMLETVLNQTLQEIEVICVDDGSEDNSEGIIRSFMEKDSRISLYGQEHLNAGAARNLGLERAKGSYVVFWDADDRFDRRALEKMQSRMEKVHADICVCGVREFTNEGKVYDADGYLKMDIVPDRPVFNKFDIRGNLYGFASNVLWNKMFRRQFLQKKSIRFQSIRQGNDTAFVMLALYLADYIACVDKKLVYYRVNNAESLTGRSSETIYCPYQAYLYTLHKLREYPNFPMVQNSFRNKAARGLFRGMNNQTSFDAYTELYEFLQKEGLAALELDRCRREDMEEEWIYEDLERIKTVSAGEFLLYKANERVRDRDQLKYTLRRVRKKLAVLLALNERFKKVKGFAAKKIR